VTKCPGITLRFLPRRRGSTSLFSARFLSRRGEYRRASLPFVVVVFPLLPLGSSHRGSLPHAVYSSRKRPAAAGHAERNLDGIDHRGNDKRYFISRSLRVVGHDYWSVADDLWPREK